MTDKTVRKTVRDFGRGKAKKMKTTDFDYSTLCCSSREECDPFSEDLFDNTVLVDTLEIL